MRLLLSLPRLGWRGVTAKDTYQHPQIIQCQRLTDLLLRGDFLFLRDRAALPWSKAQSHKVLLWQRPDPQQEALGTRAHLPPWGLAWFPFPPRGERKKTEPETTGEYCWRDSNAKWKRTQDARLDLPAPSAPPLRLRADTVPAEAQGSTAGHPPTSNVALAGRRWMVPHPRHKQLEATSGQGRKSKAPIPTPPPPPPRRKRTSGKMTQSLQSGSTPRE